MRTLLVLLLLSVLTLGVSGCVSLQKGESAVIGGLQPAAALRFIDIPYPAGFRVLVDKSFILESGGVRAGILRYTGRADMQNIVMFYKTQMPVHNWALLNVLEYAGSMLNFERENESCVVSIEQKGKRLQISITLAPKSPMPAPVIEKRVEDVEVENIKVIEGKQPVRSK